MHIDCSKSLFYEKLITLIYLHKVLASSLESWNPGGLQFYLIYQVVKCTPYCTRTMMCRMSARLELLYETCHNGDNNVMIIKTQISNISTTWGCICTKISLRSLVPGPGHCLVWSAEHVENAVPVHACALCLWIRPLASNQKILFQIALSMQLVNCWALSPSCFHPTHFQPFHFHSSHFHPSYFHSSYFDSSLFIIPCPFSLTLPFSFIPGWVTHAPRRPCLTVSCTVFIWLACFWPVIARFAEKMTGQEITSCTVWDRQDDYFNLDYYWAASTTESSLVNLMRRTVGGPSPIVRILGRQDAALNIPANVFESLSSLAEDGLFYLGSEINIQMHEPIAP